MSREAEVLHKIALLATGDEISQGDILNSNSQEIALRLTTQGMQVRMHAAAPDSIYEIEQALRFLLTTHQAVIITGGLGPTSDDLTRYALSKVIDRPLIFNAATWENITTRLKKFGYNTPPESNRQQAFFPEGATIIPNANGTAAGCVVSFGEQLIFMLPGPPIECLPMVDSAVITQLQQAHFQQTIYRKKWLLFGVSEGKIAEELDAIAKPFECVTGYRLWYPYIEFKLHSKNQTDFNELLTQVEKVIQPYLLDDGKNIASAVLREKLLQLNTRLAIADYATGGVLEATLVTPDTYSHLNFANPDTENYRLEIHGLHEFWQNQSNAKETTLKLLFFTPDKQHSVERILPMHGKRIIAYAVEYICHQITVFISGSGLTRFINATS